MRRRVFLDIAEIVVGHVRAGVIGSEEVPWALHAVLDTSGGGCESSRPCSSSS